MATPRPVIPPRSRSRCPVSKRERLTDQSERERQHDGRSRPLHRPCRDQLTDTARGRAHDRRGCEQPQTDDVDLPASESVTERGAGEHQRGNARLYALIVHSRSDRLAPKWALRVGRAVETTTMSREVTKGADRRQDQRRSYPWRGARTDGNVTHREHLRCHSTRPVLPAHRPVDLSHCWATRAQGSSLLVLACRPSVRSREANLRAPRYRARHPSRTIRRSQMKT